MMSNLHTQEEWDTLHDRVAKLEKENERIKKFLNVIFGFMMYRLHHVYHNPPGLDTWHHFIEDYGKTLGIINDSGHCILDVKNGMITIGDEVTNVFEEYEKMYGKKSEAENNSV